MLNCKITKPVSTVCDTNVAGILKMAIVNWSDAFIFTHSSGCTIDTIDLGDEHFLPIAVQDNSGSATAVLSQGASKDSKAINHQVNGIFTRIDCDLQDDWKNFLLGTVVIAVLTKNRQVLIFGADNGLTATNFDFATGAAEGDQTGITFLFEGIQSNPPLIVKDWATIKALYPQGVNE